MSSENSNNDNEECGKFPEGMRVLVVDDNIVCLNFISDLLIKCCYQVTPKQNSTEALALLTQNDDNYFDILLTNVNKYEDEDAFNLLKVGFELDIPVILMSESDNKDMIMKGIRYGAKDFLLKPIHMEEIKVIWRHVYCKNIKSFLPKPKKEPCDVVINGVDEETISDVGKRERVRWTRELHDQFVEAVQKLGGVDKAVPKKILDMMGCKDYMTREKVASHLQKYRKAIIKSKKVRLEQEVIRKKKNLPLQYQNSRFHSNPHPPILVSNSKLVGPNMQGGLLGPTTMAGFNYPSYELGNVVINGRFGNGVTTNFAQPLGTIEANNSILAQLDNHHHHHQLQTSTPQQQQQHYLDVKGLESLGYFESSVANEVDNNSCVISDDFFNEICPSLLDI